MIEWILSPENTHRLQMDVVGAYLASLPPDQFPAAYRGVLRLTERERHEHLMVPLVASWASKDPETAWKTARPWFETTVIGDHFADSWEQKLTPPRQRYNLRTGHLVPSEALCQAFHTGLLASALPADQKSRLEQEYQKMFTDAFGDETFGAPNMDSSINFTLIEKMLAASITDLPALLNEAVAGKQDFAVTCGIRRWLVLSPESGDQAVEWARKHAQESVDDALAAWAACRPEQAYSWAKNHPDLVVVQIGSAMMAHLPMNLRKEILDRVQSSIPADQLGYDEVAYVLARWAVKEPARVFTIAATIGGRDLYSETALEATIYMGTLVTHRKPVLDAIKAFPIRMMDEHAYMVMEEWGDINSAESSQYGIDWLVREYETEAEPLFTKEYLIKVWSGQANASDGDMCDRTYGCLRMWAMVAPKEMAAWSKTLPDPDIRKALEWLLAHAEGGFLTGSVR